MGDLSKESVAEAIKARQAASTAQDSSPSLLSRLANFINGDPEKANAAQRDRLADIGARFGKGGCQAISNRVDWEGLNKFDALPDGAKAKVPGADKVAAVIETCKP